jgi:hypothetical protein
MSQTRIIHEQFATFCQRCLQGINSSAKGNALEYVTLKSRDAL